MFPTTIEAIKAILRADPTVTPYDRATLMTVIRNHGRTAPAPAAAVPAERRLLRRAEVAKRLARSVRAIDHLAKQGVLKRVVLPGRRRGGGFLLEEVERLLVTDRGDKEQA